jgi:uncharacterized protein YdhG (YjbR/CyaY superfamily)
VNTVTTQPSVTSIDEYMAQFPAETQKVLAELRELIGASVPDATETISYGMPAFDLNGKHPVFFAGYERHVGLYPAPIEREEFKEDLKPYNKDKGSVQFPLGEPLPIDLIRRILAFQVERARATSK